MRNNSVKLFWIWTRGSGGNVLERHFFLEFWQPLCLVEQNHLCKFGRRHHEEQFCEIILNLEQWFRKCGLKVFYLELWRPFRSADWNHLCNFGWGYYEEKLCEIILNLDQWFKRCCFKIFLIWSSGCPFVQQIWTICAILVEGIMMRGAGA